MLNSLSLQPKKCSYLFHEFGSTKSFEPQNVGETQSALGFRRTCGNGRRRRSRVQNAPKHLSVRGVHLPRSPQSQQNCSHQATRFQVRREISCGHVSIAYCRTLCAFLNSNQGGQLFLGINDDGRVVGMKMTDDQVSPSPIGSCAC
jgi:hypothetical protein